MQSFIAKHSDHEEQVIWDGNFLIIIKKLPSPAKVDVEYKLAKNKARNKGAKIKHLFEKKTIIEEIKHKPVRKILRKRKVMRLPIKLEEEENGQDR